MNGERWCKGEIGREHVNKWIERHHDEVADPELYEKGWHELVCVNCRRQFDYCAAWLGLKGRCRCGQHVNAPTVAR